MLAAARDAGQTVRIRGAGTKSGWGAVAGEPQVELRTRSLDEIVEHNVGDLTACSKPACRWCVRNRCSPRRVRCWRSIRRSARVVPRRSAASVATGDSGPLRHRYGGVRDLVIGITVALSDGTVARSGGKVIKNVAGYDLAKLFAGSFGTLGAILSVNVRLHPRPPAHATALGASGDPAALQAAARALSAAPLELDSLDVAWHAGRGGILARLAGVESPRRAERAAARLRESGLEEIDVISDDARLWARQRAGQRSEAAALVRVSARPSLLTGVLQRSTPAAARSSAGRRSVPATWSSIPPPWRDSAGELPASCMVGPARRPGRSRARSSIRGGARTARRSS